MKLKRHFQNGYFFGYGADQEEDMIFAVSGERPQIVGKAILPDYELRVQTLAEITTAGANPQQLLRKAWGNSFKSYVIMPRTGATVEGVLFKLSLKARNKMDNWELVQLGWYDKKFVKVKVIGSNKTVRAETQVLGQGQSAKITVKPGNRSWLMPKHRFLTIARKLRQQK